VQVHQHKFSFGENLGKMPENLSKIHETRAKYLKIWTNSLKIRAKVMAPDVV